MRLAACGRVSVALAFAVAAPRVAAQSSGAIVVDAHEAPLRCLVVPAQPIEYPPEMATLKEGGAVRVRATFTGGEESPKTEAFFASDDRLRALVLRRVGEYRMPCLARGESQVVTQEFQFDPGDGRRVVSAQPRAPAREGNVVSCIRVPSRLPAYPSRLVPGSDVTHGRVLAQARFTSADGPPDVDILFDGGSPRFASAVRSFVSEYRAPCLTAAQLPLTMRQRFEFRLEGERVNLLKDSTLSAFVGSLVGLDKHRVHFDFATMGCPFDVRFVLWQPHAMNEVGEIERADPNRREFIEWLRTVDLNAPKRLHNEIVGDSMTISLPCGVLDLR